MAEKTILCTCITCLNENSNGVLLIQNTYNRHRRKQQELLERELRTEHQEENFELQTRKDLAKEIDLAEDMDESDNQGGSWDLIGVLDEDNNILEDSDVESFSFNEDNEYYSDYDNEEIDENADENMTEIDENEDMQIDDDHISKEIIEGLKLLHLKSLYNFTESAYEDIMKIFTTDNLSLYKVKKYLKSITELEPTFYDMCENSCICYTENYESCQNCPMCDSSRLDGKGKAKKVMPYLSIKDRLKIQFNDVNRAKELLYRHEYITKNDDDDLGDIFDGNIYKELSEENIFINERDVAFIASCDGYQIFKQKTDDCWLFLMINNNLDPSLRVKKENLLVPFLIPGPNQPKDFNSFLRPFIDEMKELESNCFIINYLIFIEQFNNIFFYFF
jgi:hypothetical protein